MAELDRIVTVNISRGYAGITTKDFGMILLVGKKEDFKTEYQGKVITLSNIGNAKDYLKPDDRTTGSLTSYNDNELHQMLTIFFGMTGRPPKIKITSLDEAETNRFSTTYTRITEDDNEWYYCVLSPSVRAECNVVDMQRVFNNEFIEDVHFSVLSDVIASNVGNSIVANSMLHNLLSPDTANASSTAVGTVKNLLVLNKSSDSGLDNYFALGVAMALAVREGGTYNPCYMSLSPAFTADKLSPGEVKNIIENNANCYHTIAGVNAFENGRCTGTYKLGAQMGPNNMGEWADTVIFIDLMRARLQEAIFGTLKSASDAKSKIPYNQAGIDVLDFKATTLLKQWVRNGQIVSFKSNNKPISETTSDDRAKRDYDGLSYTAQLAGAINTVVINVNLED